MHASHRVLSLQKASFSCLQETKLVCLQTTDALHLQTQDPWLLQTHTRPRPLATGLWRARPRLVLASNGSLAPIAMRSGSLRVAAKEPCASLRIRDHMGGSVGTGDRILT